MIHRRVPSAYQQHQHKHECQCYGLGIFVEKQNGCPHSVHLLRILWCAPLLSRKGSYGDTLLSYLRIVLRRLIMGYSHVDYEQCEGWKWSAPKIRVLPSRRFVTEAFLCPSHKQFNCYFHLYYTIKLFCQYFSCAFYNLIVQSLKRRDLVVYQPTNQDPA